MSKPVTADTITDEQIREVGLSLKRELAEMPDDATDQIRAIHDLRDLVLAAVNRYGYRRDPLDTRGPEFDTVRSARARCAEIWNARKERTP